MEARLRRIASAHPVELENNDGCIIHFLHGWLPLWKGYAILVITEER
jgi:hypothetical protein